MASIPVAILGLFVWSMNQPTTVSVLAPIAREQDLGGSTQGIAKERMAAVVSLVEEQGGTVKRNRHAPNIVYITVSEAAVRTMTRAQAHRMAQDVYSRLGENAIVYIENPDGITLGQAAAWRME